MLCQIKTYLPKMIWQGRIDVFLPCLHLKSTLSSMLSDEYNVWTFPSAVVTLKIRKQRHGFPLLLIWTCVTFPKWRMWTARMCSLLKPLCDPSVPLTLLDWFHLQACVSVPATSLSLPPLPPPHPCPSAALSGFGMLYSFFPSPSAMGDPVFFFFFFLGPIWTYMGVLRCIHLFVFFFFLLVSFPPSVLGILWICIRVSNRTSLLPWLWTTLFLLLCTGTQDTIWC